MSDSKRYYWLRLKKDFFQQHQIKVLKSLPNGRLYALIYLELLAESTSHNGELRYSEMMPYDTLTLSSVIDEDKDNVEKAIQTLAKLELIEIIDDGTIYMREIERLIGSETESAKRKRIYRSNQKKQIELKESFTPPTIDEVREYCEERNNGVDYQKFYEYYDIAGWIDGKGKPVKNWKQKMIATWEKNNPKKEEITPVTPVYDTSVNKKLSDKELDELLALRGGNHE